MDQFTINLLRFAVFMGPLVLSWGVQAGISLLLPGKRGKLSTERTHYYEDLELETLKKYMRQRLLAENFKMEKETDPYVIEAKRQGPRIDKSVMDAYPYPKLQMKVRVEFLPHSHGTQARMIVTSMTYILRDTGESQYLEAFLDFLMGKKAFKEVKPDLNENTLSSIYIALMTLFVPWILFSLDIKDEHYVSIAGITAVPILTSVVQAVHGIIQIGMKPTRTRGYHLAAIGIGLAALSGLSLAAAIILRLG
jgi:hypothetical protein